MTAATTFSRQNDAGSRACTTLIVLRNKNLVLVVILVLESIKSCLISKGGRQYSKRTKANVTARDQTKKTNLVQ